LIIESVNNGLPVIHVSFNYRLGILGFAKSAALSTQNAALRDQRMALEWVQENIAAFGGDPENITIHGQSSGGLSVGLQIMAYGGSKPVPFHKAIAQSQVLEPGITGTFTDDAMARVLNASTCNTTSVDSQATIDCLRTLSASDLIKLQTATAGDSYNIGDIWLPTVDGDILPSAPSQLLSEGRFAAITTIMGYTEDDTAPFTDIIIKTANETEKFFRDYAPAMSEANLQHLLSLYPVREFTANPSANLSAEFYRSARILRDILMVCEPLLYGKALTERGQKVYYYDQNQTVVDGPLESLGLPGLGVVHTSEFAYMFNNISHYDSKQENKYLTTWNQTKLTKSLAVNDYSYNPTASDQRLAIRETRSFSTFASLGQPSLKGHGTLEGWEPAFGANNETRVFVIGSEEEGLHSLSDGSSVIGRQRLEERCAFINSPEVVEQLQF
jgi:carboxylesterase type B